VAELGLSGGGVDDLGMSGGGIARSIGASPAPMYSIISGQVSPEDREKIIDQYNSPGNRDGSKIRIILLSKAGSQGIELKRSRFVIKMEPSWNMMVLDQFDARGIRFGSHVDLPKDEQRVQPYLLLSDYPVGTKPVDIKEPTTDVDLYTKAMKGKTLINDFDLAMIEASVDCNIHSKKFDSEVKKRINCRMCGPTDKKLYNEDIDKDMLVGDTCQKVDKQQVAAKEIYIKELDKKFFYSKDVVKKIPVIVVYEFDEELMGYKIMSDTNPHKYQIENAIKFGGRR
jgi:SNF2 family DNA or RNA helicase